MLGPCYAFCHTCEADTTFMDMVCKRCATSQDCLPSPRGIDKTDYEALRLAQITPRRRPQVSWRPLQSSRHVKDFYAEGHEVFQVGTKNKRDRIVYSRGEEQRLLEKHGLSPEDGMTPLKNDEGHDIF